MDERFGPGAERHVVDQLIEERALRLRANRLVWPLVRALVYPALGYNRAVAVADRMAGLQGPEAMDWARDFLSMTVQAHGAGHVPERGTCLITANHPGGIADGIALWQALSARRPDMIFFANRDALRVCAGLSSLVIPVEWRAGARSRANSRETLRAAVEAFREERCVVMFPAGRMPVWNWRKLSLEEQGWASTAAGLARKFSAPVIPLGVRQRMSLLFHALGQIHEELRHMTVFHELLVKRGARYRLDFGAPLDPAGLPDDEDEAIARLRAASLELARPAGR